MYSFLIILCLLINIQINTNATAINRATSTNKEEQSAEEALSTEHRAFTNSHGYQFLNEEPLAETARHKVFDAAKIKYHGKYNAKENPLGRRQKRDAYTNIPPAPTLPPLNFEELPDFVKTLLSSRNSATISNPSPTTPNENIWRHNSNPAESIINNTMSFFPAPSQNLKNEYAPKTYGLNLRGNEGFAWNNIAESQQPQVVYYGTIKQNKETTPKENSIHPKEMAKIMQHKLDIKEKTAAQDTKADKHKEHDILKWIEKEEEPQQHLADFDKITQEITQAKDFKEKLKNMYSEVKPIVESTTINNEMTHKPHIDNQINNIEPKSEVLNILHKIFIDEKDINNVSEINEHTKKDVKSEQVYNDKLHTIDSKTNTNKYLPSFKLSETNLNKGTGTNELSFQFHANDQTNKNNEIEETLENKMKKSFKNIMRKIPAYRQNKNDLNMNKPGTEMGSLKHTYGMHIKGDSGFVWNKLTPNDHEYYVGEQIYGETKGHTDEIKNFKEKIDSTNEDIVIGEIDNDKNFIASTKIPPEVFKDINKNINETNINSSVHINDAFNEILNPTVNTITIENPIVFENSAEQKETPDSHSEQEMSTNLPKSLESSQESFTSETRLRTTDNGVEGHSTGVTVAAEEVIENSTDAKNVLNLEFLLEPPTKESSQESSTAGTSVRISDHDIEGHSNEVITTTEDLIEESPEAKNTLNLEFLLQPLLTTHFNSMNNDNNNSASQDPFTNNETENKNSKINELFNKMNFNEININNDNVTLNKSVNEENKAKPVHTEKPNTDLNEISPIIIFKEESNDDDDKKLINIRSYETPDEVKKENNWKDTIASLQLPELDVSNGIGSSTSSNTSDSNSQANKQPIELETRVNTVQNKGNNDSEKTHQGTMEKSDNIISKIPEFIQSRNMASEAGSLEHTYGMNIKGDNAYVWNKLAPNNHEYYLGEQKTNDEIENHNDKTNNSDLKNGNECANLDYLLETAEFWEWFSKWSSSYKEIINETIRHLVSQEIVKQFTERNININNIEERRTDKNKIKPESNQTDTSMNVKAHRIYGNSLGSDHVTNIFVFNDINSSNKDDENVIADDNITSNESNETVSDTPVEAPNSTPSTTASITDADLDDDDGSDSIITEDHLNDIISTTNENNDEKVSEPVPKYELYTDLDDYDKTLPLNNDGNSTDKLIDVRSCDVADKDKKGYNSQTITNLVNEEVVKQLTDIKSNKNEKPDKVATKPNANKISTTTKVEAQTIYGNSLGSDHVTNIFVFFPNTKTLKDITSANSFEKTTSKDGDRNTHKSNAVIGLNLNADLPTIITGHKSTSKGTRLPNRANNVPYEATPELLESATANKSEANKTHKEINTLKDGTYNTLLVNDSETTIQAGNKYLKDSKDISKKEPNTIPVENVTELNNYNIASTTQPITIDDNDQQIDWIRLLKNIAKDPTQLIPIDVRMGYDNDIETISPSEETELVDTVTSAPETEVNDDSKTPKWSNDVVGTTEIQKKDKTVINDVINSILKEKIIGIDSNKDDDNRIISNANNKKTISERITTPLPNITGTNNDSRSLGAITTSGVVITTEIEDSTTASIDAVVTSAPEENVTKIGNVQPSTVDEKRIDWIKLLENIAKDPTQLIPIEDRMENDNDIESISQPEETEIVDTVTSAPDENATEIIDYSTTTTSNDDVAEKAEVQNKDETIINDLINSILMEENIGIDSDKVDDNRIISIENKKKTKSEQISTPLPIITGMNNDSTSSGAMTTKDVEITTEIEDSTTTTTEIENYSTTISVKSIGESEITTKINDNNETVIDTVVTSQPEENIEEIESTTFSVKPTFETVTTTEIEDNKKTTGDALIMPSSNGNVTEMNDDSRTTTSSTDVVGRTEVQKNDETVINDVINSIVMEKRIGIDGDSDDDNRIITIENEKKTVSEQIITPLPIITGMNNDSTSLGGMTTSNVQIMTENEDGKVTFINSVVTSAPEENVTIIENYSTTISVKSIGESEITTKINDNNETVIDTVVTSQPEENIEEIESTTLCVKPTIETVIITETEDNKETTVDALIMPSSNENVTEMNDDSTTTTSSTDVVERTEEQKNDETVINDVINSILMEKRIGIDGDSDEYDNDNRVIAIENEKKTVSEQITTPSSNITGMNNDSTSLEGMTTSNVEIMTENEDGKVTFINAVVTSAPEENVTKIENDSTTISVTSISESEMMTEIKDNNENDAVVTSKSEENIEETESTTFSVKPTFETVPTTEIEDNKKTTGDALIMPSLNENVTEMNDDSATTTSSTDFAERTKVQKNDETVINDVINSILMEKRIGIDGDGIEDDDIRIIAIENKKKTVSEQITTPLPNITGMNNDSTYLGGMTENEDGKVTLINAIVTSAPEENVTKIEKDSTTISVTSTSENEMMTEIKNNNENVIDAVVISEPEENIKEIERTTFSVKPTIETVTTTEIEDNNETTVDAVVMSSSNKNVTKMNDDSTPTTSSNDVAEMDKIVKQETPNTTLGMTPTSNIETTEIENNIKSVVNAVVTSPKPEEKNVTETVTTTEITDKKEIAPVENVTEMNGDSAPTASNINVPKAEVQKIHETALNNIIKSIIVEKRIGIENAEDEDKIINSIDMEKAVTSINSESTTLQAITIGDADTLTEIEDNQETIVNAMITPAPEENLTEIDNDSASLKVLSISNVETATEDNYNDITLLEDFTASMPDDLLEINNEVFKKK